MQAVISAKQKLLDIESQLTSAERERYQMSINSVNVGINDVKEQSEAYDEQKKSIDRLIKSQVNLEAQQEALHRVDPSKTVASDDVKKQMSDRIDALYKKDSDVDMQAFNVGPVFADMEEVLENVDDPLQALLQRFKQLTQVMEATADASQGLEDIDKHLETTDAEQNLKRLVTILENFQSQLKETGAKTEQIDTILSGLKNGTLDVKKGLEQATTAMTLYKNAGKSVETTTTILTTKLGVAESALEELKEQSSRSISMFRRMQASMKDVAQAADDMLAGKGGKGSLGEKFIKIAQGATSAVSAFSTWSSVTKNWDGMSFSESLGSIAELVTDIATSGSLSGAIMTAAGAAIGAGLGYIERIQEENLENINRINESIDESVEDINTSAKVADQAMKNYKEASEAFDKDAIGQSEYLTIIDSVLEALDAEHLKIFALKEDYVGLRTAIEKANQERLAGDVAKAENLVNTGYYNLAESLNAYSGKNADTGIPGRNGISLDWNNANTEAAMQFLGFSNYGRMFGLDQDNWSWEGNQSDLIQLQNNWEKLQTDNKYKTFRESKDFAILTEYMKQFDTVFAAMDSWARSSASKKLSELDITSLTPENAYEEILNTVLTSFGTSAEKATPYQMQMAQNIAKDWVANLSTGIQTGFYEGLNNDQTAKTAKEYAAQYTSQYGHQYIKADEDATLPTFLLTKNEEGKLANAISQAEYDNIEKYKNYVSAWNASNQSGANIEALLASTGIDPAKIGIHLAEGQSISDYLATASEQTKNALLENLRAEIDTAITSLNIDPNNYSTQFEGIIKDQQQEVLDFFTNSIKNLNNQVGALNQSGNGFIHMDNVKYAFGQLYQDTEGLYRDAWKQLKFDENGVLQQDSYDKLMTSSIGMQLDKNVLDTMIDLEKYNLFDFDSAFGYIFSIWDGRIKDFESWWQGFINTTKTEVEKTQNDFNQLKELDADHIKWDEDEFNMFSTQARKYGIDTADWSFKTEAQQSEDVYNVMKSAFDQQWAGQNWTQAEIEADPKGYSNYISNYTASLQELNRYALQETESTMGQLETEYSNVEEIFSTLMSMDLSKNIDDTIVSAEKFSKIMGMTIDEFNSNYGTASQKQLALLQAQQKHSQKYANDLAEQVQQWYDATGKELIDRGDQNAMQTWAILSQQVSAAQADAAQSAQAVNAAYATLNDEAVAGIAAQWERANKEAEKQQQIAQILSSSVDSGIISNEEAALVGYTAQQWAQYSIEVRAAIAAQKTLEGSTAVQEQLKQQQQAVVNASKYLTDYAAQIDWWRENASLDELFHIQLDNNIISPETFKEIKEAYDSVISEFGDKISTENLITQMSIKLGIDKSDLETQMAQVAGAGKDAINSIFSTMSRELQEKAQDAVDAWQEAFDKIAAAKEKLASGGSLLEDIAGDPEALIFYAQQLGMSVEEAYNKIVSGMIDESQLKMPTFDLENAKAIYGLDKGIGQGRAQDAIALGYEESDIGTDAFQSKVIPYYQKILMASGKYTEDAALELATSIARGTESYDLITEGASHLATALPLAAEAAETFAQRNIDAANIEKAAEIDQQKYDNQTELQAALEEARDVKQENGDWKDISLENRSILEANGITGLNQVDAAAIECASALAQLAQAAYEAAKKEAEDAGYTQNEDGAWGIQHTLTEEQGRLDYGSDWDQYKTTLTQNEDGTYNQGFEVVKEINDPMQEAEKRVQNLQGQLEDLPTDLWEEDMESFGLNPDEVDELGDSIQEMAESSDELADSLKHDAEAADEVAKELQRYGNAVEDVEDNYKDWMKALQSDDLTKQTKTIKQLDKAYSDMLDLDYDSLSKDFLTNAENLELMKKAAEGSEEAYDELAQKAGEDILMQVGIDKSRFEWDKNQVDNWCKEINGKSLDDIEVGASLDNADFLNALSEMVSAAGMTADQATSYLASMGIDAEVETNSAPETQTYVGAQAVIDPQEVTYINPMTGEETTSSVPSIHYEPSPIQVEGEKQATSLKVTSANKSSGGGFKHRNSGGGSGGGKGGGGGSPQKKEKKKHKRTKDHVERYHENNEVLKRIGEELEKIDKLKDRTYGKNHVDQLDAETEALEEQLLAQKALREEALAYAASDRNGLYDENGELKQEGLVHLGATFDADGNISNYDELVDSIVQKYNAAVDVYNKSAQSDADKERLEAAEQEFEDHMQMIEDYEEALATAAEAGISIQEIMNKISEIKLEKITYELEVKLDLNERDVKLLEYYSKKYEEYLDKQDEVFNNTINKALEYQEDLNHLYTAYDQLVAEYMNGTLTEADYIQGLQDIQDQIVDKLSDLNDIQNQLAEVYENTLSMAAEEIGKLTSALDENNSVLQSYMDILNLLSTHGTDYEAMDFFYNKMNENNLHNIGIQRDAYNLLLKEEDKFQQILAERGKLTELEQKEYDSLQEKIREAKQTLVTTTEEAMQLLRSQYENTIASIANSLFDFSEIGAHSLDHLQDQYGYFQEQQERYVSTAKALTEVSKLNRDIEGQLAQSVSASSKQALKDLQAKINKQNELNKMTEYDIEMNQLQYQLLLARIKLEEAENAKDVVRLTRDDNGNYAYQYTANQDKLDEAAQNYEDVLQQINDSTAQRTSEIEQRILDTMANYKEKLQEVATDYSLSEEERYARMEELSARFKETMYYLDEEYQKATNNLGENQAAMAKHYGMSVEEISKGTAGTFNESIKTMMGSMNTYVQSGTDAFGKDSDFTKAWETLQNGMTELSRASGLTFGSMVEDTEEMATEEQSMVAQAEKLLSMLDDSLEPIGKATTAWNTHAAAIKGAIDNYEALAKLIQDVLGAMSGYGNTTPTTSSTNSNSTTASVPVGGAHAKGGLADYTGLGWLDGTEQDPELVLNPEDTHNMLKIVDTVRKIDPDSLATLMEAYKINLASMYASLNMMNMSSIMSQYKTSDVLEQYVTITAEFPNASDRNEIKEVFDGLVNRAAQFAKRKK